MILRGDLGCLDPAWSGWVLKRGVLCSPENWTATPGEIRAMQLKEAQVSFLRQEVFQLRAELEAAKVNQLEEQPLPGNWEISLSQ